jgi:large subunit ribosomal protein L9
MDVILKKDVEHLGYANDLVKVRDGYARNFLLPRGLAVSATEGERKQLDETLKQRAHKEAKLKGDAEKHAERLAGKVLTITAKVGEKGKIFGSINTIMLADAMRNLGVEVERKHIKLRADQIKSVGKYEAEVVFHKEVVRNVPFEVVAE